MARIVLVHGAFAGAWCWAPVLPGLRAAGHTVDTLDLPGSGEDRTPRSRSTMPVAAARGALFGCCDDEQAASGVAHLGGQPVV